MLAAIQSAGGAFEMRLLMRELESDAIIVLWWGKDMERSKPSLMARASAASTEGEERDLTEPSITLPTWFQTIAATLHFRVEDCQVASVLTFKAWWGGGRGGREWEDRRGWRNVVFGVINEFQSSMESRGGYHGRVRNCMIEKEKHLCFQILQRVKDIWV